MKTKRDIRITPYAGPKGVGRPSKCASGELVIWRHQNGASIAQAARHFGVSVATVKRHCAAAKHADVLARERIRKAVDEGQELAKRDIPLSRGKFGGVF